MASTRRRAPNIGRDTAAPRRQRTRLAGCTVAVVLAGLLPLPAAAAEPCWAGVFTDLDGGGPDVVVGLPSYDLPGRPDAGAVAVFSNVAAAASTQPRTPRMRRLITADDIPGLRAQAGARFGASVVVTPDGLDDVDACADLWVGAPGQTVAGRPGAGRVHILAGSDSGPRLREVVDLSTLPVGGGPQAGAGFGSALAIDLSSTVAIGEPGRNVGGVVDAGRVIRLDDLSAAGTPRYSVVQEGGSGAGVPERGDRFGEVLAVTATGAGTLLLIGVPHEDVADQRDAGAVALHPRSGPLSILTQNSPGAAGRAEAGDRFGASLGVHASFLVDHPVEVVAIGTPGEDLGALRDAGGVFFGRVDLFASEAEPVSPIRSSRRSQTQDTPGLPGRVEAGDRYGTAVVSGEFGVTGGVQRLAVTAPGEALGRVADAGLLTMTTIDESTGAPVPGGQPGAWSQDAPGVSGRAEAGDRFGGEVSAVQLTRNVSEGQDDEEEPGWPVILVTVPGEDRGAVPDAGLAYLGVAPGRGSVPLLPPDPQAGAGEDMVPMQMGMGAL